MYNIMVAGAGIDVGKTVVSAILTTLVQGDYWKPIQCGDGEDSDTATIKKLIGETQHTIHPPAYSLKAPISPHHAARLEGISIRVDAITPPRTTRPLIIEGVGGVFVPLTTEILSFDLYKTWECRWVVVSRNYVGSINHTLLTLNVLKQHQIPIAGLIFNGEPNPDSEEVILKSAQLPLLGRVLPEPIINSETIQRYAQQWHSFTL